MELNLLRTFVAAYEEASFTKAAERLNSTQPGVSVQIATLESLMEAPLFERNPRSVTPTAAGKRLYPRALQLIHDFKSAQLDIRSLSGSITGRVSVGLPPALSRAILAPVLSRYVTQYPDVEVRVLDAYSDTLLSRLKNRELDVGIVAHLADDPAITSRKIFRDRFVAVSGVRSGITPNRPVQLNVEPYFKIVIPSVLRNALHSVLDEALRVGDIVPARMIEINGLSGILDFVSMTDWVALVPAASAYNRSDNTNVRFNRIAGNEITIDYFAANARTEPVSPPAQAFIDLATAELDRVANIWRVHEEKSLRRARAARDV